MWDHILLKEGFYRRGDSLASLRGALAPAPAAPVVVLAPEPGCAGRDSACEVLSGKQGARNGPPGTFLPWTQRPESAYSLGRLGTALRTWVVGSEVFTARVLISNNRQISPMRFCLAASSPTEVPNQLCTGLALSRGPAAHPAF